MAETPQEGWWPLESNAPITQMFFQGGKGVANIVKTSLGWRAYSLTELNDSGTGGKPIGAGSVSTREEAQKQVEDYLAQK